MVVWLDIHLELQKKVNFNLHPSTVCAYILVLYGRAALYLWEVWVISSCSCDMQAHQNIKGQGEYREVPFAGN